MTFTRWWRWSKHFTSSTGTPLFIRNGTEGSASFQFSSQLSLTWNKRNFLRFCALVKLFYTCCMYSSFQHRLCHTLHPICMSLLVILWISWVMKFWARHKASFCQSSNFSEFLHRNFRRDSEGQLLNSYAFIFDLDHGNLLPLYISFLKKQ
jgi:hypothetical protein